MNVLSFLERRRQQRALKLYDEARELVDDGLHEEALAIARKLRKLHYTGAFEIEGLAYAGLNRNEDAVRVLREGLARAPQVWMNWMLLGSCLSNLSRYEEALLAYDRAQASPDASPPEIDLNRAIMAIRQQEWVRALNHLDHVRDTDARLRVIGCRVTALRGAGRIAEAEDLGSRTLREWRDIGGGDGSDDIGSIAVEVAQMRGDRSFAIDYWRATRHAPLLWTIRELQPVRSPAAQYFRLVLHGVIAGERFLTSADVVADSEEEAFALLREILPPEEGVNLEVETATSLEPSPDDPKGVYRAKGRVFYKEE